MNAKRVACASGSTVESVKLGQKIRIHRLQHGITQMELAERIGVSYQQVQKYERDQSQITVERLFHIADALETTAVALLSERNVPRLSEKPGAYVPGGKARDRSTADEGRLLQLYVRIKSRQVKLSILRLLESVVADQSGR